MRPTDTLGTAYHTDHEGYGAIISPLTKQVVFWYASAGIYTMLGLVELCPNHGDGRK